MKNNVRFHRDIVWTSVSPRHCLDIDVEPLELLEPFEHLEPLTSPKDPTDFHRFRLPQKHGTLNVEPLELLEPFERLHHDIVWISVSPQHCLDIDVEH